MDQILMLKKSQYFQLEGPVNFKSENNVETKATILTQHGIGYFCC